jgi:hypothetical protein
MSTQPVLYEVFQDVDDVPVELDVETAESSNVVRGFLFGISLSVPFWVAVYWFLRSL